jgi:hypothetical protein
MKLSQEQRSGILGGTTVVGLVKAFIKSKTEQRVDLAEKRSGNRGRKR